MNVWLLQRPWRVGDRHDKFFARINDEKIVETTRHELLAKRFATASEARAFASAPEHDGHFDTWRVVRK